MYQFDHLFAGITGLGIGNGMVFALYLLRQARGGRQLSRWLGFFMLLLSLRFALTTIHYFYRTSGAELASWGLVCNLMLGPLWLAYVHAFFRMSLPPRYGLIHGWPAFALSLGLLFLPSSWIQPFQPNWFILNQLTLVHWVLYLGYTFRWSQVLFQEKARAGYETAALKHWLNGLLLFMGCLILGYSFNNAKLLCVIFCPLFYTIVVYLILGHFVQNITTFQKPLPWESPKFASLSSAKIARLKQALQHLMTEEEVFRDPELSLDKVAQRLEIGAHVLSHYVNTYEGAHFSDWVNRYRVQYVAKLLVDPAYEHLKIAAIAHHSGFNTLSVFNHAFKKGLGCTPSAYRKNKEVAMVATSVL